MAAQTIEALRDQLASAEQLHQVTKTMRTLAAVNIRQYEQSVEAVTAYFETMEWGLHVALRDREIPSLMTQPSTGKQLGAIVFGSDQGLVGQFNNRIVRHALDRMADLDVPPERRTVLVVGKLAAATLTGESHPVETQLGVPSSAQAITEKVRDILLHLERWRADLNVDHVILIYNRPTSGASYEPTVQRLLPLSREWLLALKHRQWKSRALPIYRLPWLDLFRGLIRQYFFVSLYRALAASLASENASRLQAMQAAERNIRERIERLERQYHHLRQSSITEEILDIASGFEALKGD